MINVAENKVTIAIDKEDTTDLMVELAKAVEGCFKALVLAGIPEEVGSIMIKLAFRAAMQMIEEHEEVNEECTS